MDLKLKKLQDIWYAKLAKKGFEDIEQRDGNLKVWHSQMFQNRRRKRSSPEAWEAKTEYYILAEHFLNQYKFKSELEQIIWKLHSEGMSYDKIAKKLKNLGYERHTSKDSVQKVIKTLAKLMVKVCSTNET